MALRDDELEFLKHSNYIEGEGGDALDDSVAAWEAVRDLKEMTAKDILNCHAVLMRSRQTLPADAKGAWTKVRTRIGKKVNPPPFRVPELMDDFVRMFNENVKHHVNEECDRSEEWRERDAKNYHVKFEGIHPFQDGNGRVGRILYQWHRIRIGLPIHVIREEDRAAYYAWFE